MVALIYHPYLFGGRVETAPSGRSLSLLGSRD